MNREAFSAITVLTLLLISTLTLAFNIQTVKSGWTGTVYIRADGSIDPPDAPIITYDNITYTLTDNMSSYGDGLIIQRDNIVFDGMRRLVQGLGYDTYFGIYMVERYNVTIKNIKIKGFFEGLRIVNSLCIGIYENEITDNEEGIGLYNSSNNTISRNRIENNHLYGIQLWQSSDHNKITENLFTRNGLSLWGVSHHNIIEENLVNNKPLVYLEGVSSYVINGDAGQVIVVECVNITIENLNLSCTDVGILLLKTNNSKIAYNRITDNYMGILLQYSSNNSIYGNYVATNKARGVYLLDFSCFNNIFRNQILNNTSGIYIIWHSSNNTIYENNIANNQLGADIGAHSYYNYLYHNNFVNNVYQTRLDFATKNVWDDGYPSGGNYWSDYTGVDLYSGPYQNGTGSDGIGDAPYVIDTDNMDKYPLMNPWGAGTPIASFAWTPSVPEVGEVVTFDASASMPVGGEIVSYKWDFGDGNHATGKIATHAYGSAGTFTVTLNVTDSEGLWDVEQRQIEVKAPAPIAAFTWSPLSPLEGETVVFDASASKPDSGEIVRFVWSFGDGGFGEGRFVTHTYSRSGLYKVTLTVFSSEGLSDDVSDYIFVRPKCFILTAVLGTDAEGDLNYLRLFRDKILRTNPVGEAFVAFYYEASPPIADQLSRNQLLRALTAILFVQPLIITVKILLSPYSIALYAALAALFFYAVKKRKLKALLTFIQVSAITATATGLTALALGLIAKTIPQASIIASIMLPTIISVAIIMATIKTFKKFRR